MSTPRYSQSSPTTPLLAITDSLNLSSKRKHVDLSDAAFQMVILHSSLTFIFCERSSCETKERTDCLKQEVDD